jgi:hypothetical protein
MHRGCSLCPRWVIGCCPGPAPVSSAARPIADQSPPPPALAVSDECSDAHDGVVDLLREPVAEGLANIRIPLADEVVGGCEAGEVGHCLFLGGHDSPQATVSWRGGTLATIGRRLGAHRACRKTAQGMQTASRRKLRSRRSPEGPRSDH